MTDFICSICSEDVEDFDSESDCPYCCAPRGKLIPSCLKCREPLEPDTQCENCYGPSNEVYA